MHSKLLLLATLTLPIWAGCGDDPDEAYPGDPIPSTPTPSDTIQEPDPTPSDTIPNPQDSIITPQDTSAIQLSYQMADSIWNLYMPDSDFKHAKESIPSDSTQAYYEDFAENWLGTDELRDVVITFDGDKVSIDWQNEGKKTKEAVKITTDGAHVVIRNENVEGGEAAGRARMNYILQGKSDNGSLRIYSNKKFMVTLDGVTLHNASGAAINAQKSLEKKRMFLNINTGTVNTLSDASEYTNTIEGEDEKGAIFSEGKLILMGNGQLNVTGNKSNAIAADDRIFVHAGVKIVIDNASKDAIHSKDEIVANGGYLKLYAAKDALQCDSMAGGLTLNGARILACGQRAVTAGKFAYKAGSFCLIGNDTHTPTSGLSSWSTDDREGYKIVVSK